MNSTTINAKFFNVVGETLLDALAEARLHAKEGEPVNGALCEFYLGGLLRECGAASVSFQLRQDKGYSRYVAKFSDGTFIEAREFWPRRKMTQAEYDTLGDIKPDDIIATAGIWEDEEHVTHVSFKWDRLVVDGKEITFGPVRKFEEKPIIAE